MDHFGIGAAMQAMARMYIQSSRNSGRTSSLVESVKDGDRLVFTNAREAERVKRLCLERGVAVDCVVINTKNPSEIFTRGTPQGRTIFDQSWVEQYYLESIERVSVEIDQLQRESSGYGDAHRETSRQAEEMSKWNYWKR